jgi:hypothetical protein
VLEEEMRIENVILTVDSNPDYRGFWPYVAEHWWTKFEIKPILMHCFREDQQVNPVPDPGVPYGEIFLCHPSDVPWGHFLDWRTTLAYLWGAAKAGGSGHRIICGIDQILLSPEILRLAEAAPDDKLFLGQSDAYSAANFKGPSSFEYVPSAYVSGSRGLFEDLLEIREDNWADFCRRVYHGRNSWVGAWAGSPDKILWGTDEAYLSCCVSYNQHRVQRNDGFFWGQLFPKIIDRALPGFGAAIDVMKLRRGEYSQVHASRPFHSNPKHLLETIRAHLPAAHYDPSIGRR